jgi:hypothetical protein
MLIPEGFFGTSELVQQRLRKAVTLLRRGTSMSAVFDQFELIDTGDRPGSLIWLDALRVRMGGEHFMIRQLGEALRGDRRLDWKDVSRIRDKSLDYLIGTPWGTLVLNCTQQYFWIQDYPLLPTRLNRRSFIAILEGICNHWDVYESAGRRFYSGFVCALTLPQCKPLAGHVLATCGVDPRGRADSNHEIITDRTGRIIAFSELAADGRTKFGWGNIARICRESGIIDRLRRDDRFWDDVCAKRREYEAASPRSAP